MFRSTPGLFGDREDTAHMASGADDWVGSLLCAVYQLLILLSCTFGVNGAAGHNRGGVVETERPRRVPVSCVSQCRGLTVRLRTASWLVQVVR